MKAKNNKEVQYIFKLYMEDAPQNYIDHYIGLSNITRYKRIQLDKLYLPNKPSNSRAIPYILLKMDLKYCPQCDSLLDIDEFRKNSSRSDGRQNSCKVCQ